MRADHEQTNLKRQIDAADRRIDRLVYDLYNLTDEEIRITEKDKNLKKILLDLHHTNWYLLDPFKERSWTKASGINWLLSL
ncbi:MAG: hypothetical protein A2X96_00595 [Syntrophobacterales bacterium GWC2_56_13]|nr:MAG: hypothetical protein A2X96_00595 [Syntrophobacterales bacterium GWC2_56_13]